MVFFAAGRSAFQRVWSYAEIDDGDGLPPRRRTLAFAVISLATTMAVLDGSIVNIALPSIARDLHVGAASAIGLVTVYQAAVVAALLPFSALGDKLGYSRVYVMGLALFTGASLLCAVLPNFHAIMAARALQGLGAAGIMGVNIALVRFIYPARMLGRGIGNAALVVGISSAAGPSLGALLLSVGRWQWLFLINVPLGLLALVMAQGRLPRTKASPLRFDIVGAILNVVTLTSFILGIDLLESRSTFAAAGVCLAVAAGLAALFVRQQRNRSAPILPLDLLRQPRFALSAATSIFSFVAQAIALIALPFVLEGEFARSTAAAGLLISAWPVATALVSRPAGRLSEHFDVGLVVAIGLAILATGLVILALLPRSAGDLAVGLSIAVCGLGFGLFQPPNNRTMLECAPPHRSGGASGMQSTSRLLGQSLGAALMAVMFAVVGRDQIRATFAIAGVMAVFGAFSSIVRVNRVSLQVP